MRYWREEWRSPKKFSRNEVTECQRWHKSVPVSGGINTSNLYSTGSLWSRKVDSKIHKLDGFPHGVMVLLLWRERSESTFILVEIFWGRESLAGFHCPWFARESRPGRMGQITLIGWKYATTITVKLIYALNRNTKSFLLQVFLSLSH